MKAKKIPSYNNYWVTNDGRVFSANHGFLIEMIPSFSHNGYHRVMLCSEEGKRNWHSVHRIVLNAWLGKNNQKFCNHKNGIKTDNRIENLEWVTHYENVQHSKTVLGNHFIGERNHFAKLTEENVRFIKSCDLTAKELGQKFKVTREAIYNIKNGRTWTHIP